MKLVYEKYYVVVLLELVQDGLHPFLKLAPVLGAGNNAADIQ